MNISVRTTGEVRLDERGGGIRGTRWPRSAAREPQDGHAKRLLAWDWETVESYLHPPNAGLIESEPIQNPHPNGSVIRY